MKRVFYRSLCAVLCVSMLSAAIPVRVIAEEERRQENTLEQSETGVADNSGGSMTGDIDTSEIDNESIKTDSDLANPIAHQVEPQVTLASDMSPDSEQATKATVSGYQHSDSASSGSVTLTVEWNDPVLGQSTTFHVSATGGSGSYLFRMEAPSYSNPSEYAYEPVADPSRGEWTKYTDACVSHDCTFTTTATGTYNFRFYLMDKTSGVYYLRTNTYIQVAEDAHPSVASIVSSTVSQAKQKTDGSEFEMALYLHDWLLEQLEYDNSLKWSSAESALTRGLGTCQAYESAYAKLLSAAGIENAETRDTYDGHTWNAVKLDGEWYQVDCTWDDTSDNFYGDLDQRHLYFCITDELMAIAHPGHEKIYSSDGYATRSTSLKDNFFVRNSKGVEWAGKYFKRIQQHLDAKETEFSIDADNNSFPPSISGIQNGIIAYAMNQMDWTANSSRICLSAKSIVTIQTINKWSVKFEFESSYLGVPSAPPRAARSTTASTCSPLRSTRAWPFRPRRLGARLARPPAPSPSPTTRRRAATGLRAAARPSPRRASPWRWPRPTGRPRSSGGSRPAAAAGWSPPARSGWRSTSTAGRRARATACGSTSPTAPQPSRGHFVHRSRKKRLKVHDLKPPCRPLANPD